MIKGIVRVHHLIIGYRFRAVIMAVILVISMWTGVKAFAEINDMLINYRVISNSKLNNAYLYSYFYTMDTFSPEGQNNTIDQIKKDLERNASVEAVFSVRAANDILCESNGKSIMFTILLYDKGMDQVFPMLKVLGIDFSDNPDGVILASRIFNSFHKGDDLSFTIFPSERKASIKVAGHMHYPYKYLSLGGGGTELSLDDLFSSGIMQATQSTLDLVDRFNYYPDLLVDFSADSAAEEISLIIEELRETGNVDSLNEIMERYYRELSIIVKQSAPRPLFFMIASMIAFLSLMIMMIRSRERDLAIAYLCGATKKKSAFEMVRVGIIIALIPTIISISMIIIVPELAWRGVIEQDESVITPDLIWFVVMYFVVIIIVSAVMVLISMGKKTPLQYLRGLE